MAIKDAEEEQTKTTDYLELNSQVLETKNTEFSYQVGKKVTINKLYGQSKVLLNEDPEDLKPEHPDF